MTADRPRGLYAVWLTGVAIYLLAVFHRSSLAVAGLEAADRFSISASQLASFTMLQLLVYAGLQIPAGLAIDRFGPRRVMTVGLIVMTIGQALFAVADDYLPAVGARVLVGAGDALTFGCVLRLVATWFPARRIPLITQLTAVTGQSAALLATLPMTWAFAEWGWTTAYLVSASVGVVLLVLLVLVVRDAPDRRRVLGEAVSVASVRRSLGDAWSHPGTRLGFWVHFTTQFSATTMSLLWGYPFLVRGEGRSPQEAGVLLSILVVAVICAGPTLALITTRWPYHRSDLVMGLVGAIVAVWTAVLLWPGHAPTWLLVVLVVVVGVGGPASIIGFEFGREYNPDHRLGAAIGIINQGGFYATLLVVVAIGIVLDWRTPGGSSAYTPESFRWAMSAQYVLWALGLVQILRLRRRTRALLAGR